MWAHGTENESIAHMPLAGPVSGKRPQLNLNHFASKKHRTIRARERATTDTTDMREI